MLPDSEGGVALEQLARREDNSGDADRADQSVANDDALRILQRAIEDRYEELLVSARVFVFQLGLTRNRETAQSMAEEAVQNAIVAAMRGAVTYNTAYPPHPWLRKIVYNTVLSMRRGRRIERRYIVPITETAGDSANAASTGPDEIVLLARLRGITEQAEMSGEPDTTELLALVSERDAEVLRLSVIDGLNGAELATALGTSEGAAYTRLSRAKARLRQRYIEEFAPADGEGR